MNEQEQHARPQDAQDPVEPASSSPAAIGARLRALREAAGLARDEFARKANMPTAVLADLEEGRFERLGAAVYVRGYLRSAARAAGVPEADLAPSRLDEMPAMPLQVAPRPLPVAPRWLTRYATPVAYAMLTAVVMVPLVYLARPSPQQLARVPSLTAIDSGSASLPASAPVTPPPATPSSGTGLLETVGPPAASAPAPAPVQALDESLLAATPEIPLPITPQPSERPAPPQPVMASLAPMPTNNGAGSGTHRVTLRLRDASWVEFTGFDGRRLEYALLPAGTTREYRLTGRAELRVGNSSGAELSIDGQSVPLEVPAGARVARVVIGAEQATDSVD